MRTFVGVLKFLCKYSLDLHMAVSRYDILVILQITLLIQPYYDMENSRYIPRGGLSQRAVLTVKADESGIARFFVLIIWLY